MPHVNESPNAMVWNRVDSEVDGDGGEDEDDVTEENGSSSDII